MDRTVRSLPRKAPGQDVDGGISSMTRGIARLSISEQRKTEKHSIKSASDKRNISVVSEKRSSLLSASDKRSPMVSASNKRTPVGSVTANPSLRTAKPPASQTVQPLYAGSQKAKPKTNNEISGIVTVKVSTTPPPGTSPCQICGRHFLQERLPQHEVICKKAATKKRKVYDPIKHRLQGTEAEGYLRQPKQTLKPKTVPKSDWRKQHMDFIANIRAAREAKEHLAKGGKLSDLPPPPPLDTSDYVPCPHCGRKFNSGAAERHIPKCVNIRHNKPKPQARAPVQRKRQ